MLGTSLFYINRFGESSVLDIGFFQTEMVLFVDSLEDNADNKSGHTQTSRHEQGPGVFVRNRCNGRIHLAGSHLGYDIGIGVVEHLTDKQGEVSQTDILNPENERVGRTQNLIVDQFGNAWPQSGRNQRERGSKNQNGDIGHNGPADGLGDALRACPACQQLWVCGGMCGGKG